MLRAGRAHAILTGMRDDRILTQLAAAGLRSPNRGRAAAIIALMVTLVGALAFWLHLSRPTQEEAAQALPQVVIASARAQNIDPIDLWDAVGRELGTPMDARQPYFGLNGRDLLRAITLASRDVRPHKGSIYTY